MSLLDDAIGKADALLQELKDAKAAIEAANVAPVAETPIAEPPALAAVPEPVDAEQVRVAEEGHDNSLPFKCPACGTTYEAEVLCTNGHPAEQTLPTADVLAGAPPSDQAAPTEPVDNQAVTETATTPPPGPVGTAEPSSSSSSSEGDPPPWPDATA